MIRLLLFSISLVGLCLLATPAVANADNLFKGVDCSKAASSAVCNDQTSSNPLTGSNGTLLNIVNIVAYIAGAAAIIVVIVSALSFITSGSDTSTSSRTDADVENARRSIASALIGLAIVILAKVLINYVVKRL